MKKIYLFLLLSVLSFGGFAQTATSYSFTNTTGTYSSISSTGTLFTGINCDDCTVTSIPIGFTFNFCGVNYTSFSACSNGFLSLANSTSANNFPNSGGIAGAGFLFPFWFDLDGAYGNSNCYYQTSGVTGSRVFTFEYNTWDIWNSGGFALRYDMNVQVKLFEGSNVVQFVYGSHANTPTACGIGIANSTADYQYLLTGTSTTTNTTGFSSGTASLPPANTVMIWCPPTAVPAIVGNTPLCPGTTATLTDATTGGIWSSSSTGLATIGSTSGIVTGVAAGNPVITYSAPNGCMATATATVNATPAAITGNAPVCVGATVTLTDASGTGTWTSGGVTIATVGSGTGVVTGVSSGTATITFTRTSTGCSTTATATVNAAPAAIAGSTKVCVGSTTTLTDATLGGTWTSSNTGQATIGSATGVVTGVSTGSPTITYTASGCSTTLVMTVNAAPAVITGLFAVCPGSTVGLSDATTGGTWSSSNTALATVGSSSGIVTGVGVSGGNPVISYTAASGCFSTQVITVNPMSPILGVLGMCTTGTSVLSDVTPGGVWSSSNPSVATIGTSGIVTAISSGTSTISYSILSTGCTATAVFGVTAAPSVFTVTGGGGYCSGGAGVSIGLSGTNTGVSYQVFSGTTAVSTPISGVGFAITFPPITTAGTYTIVANPGSTCATTMSGSATITINPLPTAFTVTGGGGYCTGGAGLHVGLSSSTIGVNYQLMNGVTFVGSPVLGTSAAIDFGLQTSAGTYTVVATNATTGCVNNMSGSVTITINSLPNGYSVTGGGGYCSGGTGVTVGLSGSDLGLNYQLLIGGVPTGPVVIGSGAGITFGLQTTPGVYTVAATNPTTTCTATMLGAVTVTVNPLPTVFTVTGGGPYCSGATGVHIGLNSSTVGVNYQLYYGTTATGAPVAGTGAAIDFGIFTTTGSYTIVATNPATGCTVNMTGSANVSINTLPLLFRVTGGGGYCAGGPGVHVGLAGSEPGITYQLYNGTTLWDATLGSGSALDFGLEPTAGFYTIVAVNSVTSCTVTMTGSATVVVNPLPFVYTVTGGGNYCAGGTGVHIGLGGSNVGTSYQLFLGTSPSGTPVAGTGVAIDFGLRTAAGSYTVVATITATGCTSIMTGSASIAINPLPLPFTVTGSGGYCSGGTGTHIGLSGSNAGFSYQMFLGGGISGPALTGTGFALDFGLRTTPGIYTVVASNTTTGCIATMTGSITVSVNPLPTAFAVTGGGNYCAGSPGVHIGVASSTSGVNYQLFNGLTAVGSAVAGTGSSIDLGVQTNPGTYTVVATNTATTCTNNMANSVTVGINALPAAFNVTGGGGYCTGGTGVHIGLNASTPGVNYQLFNGVVPVGAPVPGTGAILDFGLQTTAGTYTVVATNTTTFCNRTMTGSATVSINPLPNIYLITGGGNYCLGTTGVNIGLSNSDIGTNYQLYLGGGFVGAPLGGTGSAISYGLQTAVGAYNITATNTTTGCTANMAGTANVNINPLPSLHLVTGGGNYCPGGTGVHVGLDVTDIGVNYQLMNGTSPVGAPVAGIGIITDFGLQTTPGIYSVVATDATTNCTDAMTGTATVGIASLPTAYDVTGTGNYCPGGSGVHVGLSGSDIGVNYQLYDAFGTIGIPIAGTGLPIDFGFETSGTYTVVATSTVTTCTNNMNGTAVVNVSPLPNAYILTGGGAYCAGGAGMHVGLSGSDTGIHYQLFLGVSSVGSPVAGTGLPLDFGLQTAAGTYTIVALSSHTTCSSNMTGSAIVSIRPLPTAYSITGGGGYCIGSSGVHIILSGSNTGISYQLYNGTVPSGIPMAGTGAILDFGPKTAAGTYTIVGTNVASSCTNTMAGSVPVIINALPVAYTVSGGGNYCSGGPGKHVFLSGSNTGVSYQLYVNGIMTGAPIVGTGFGLDFGPQTTVGGYTVKATNTITSCVNIMTGSVMIAISPLPNVYSVSSTSSNYCIGGAGVDISLTGSDVGVNYQLYLAGAAVGSPVAGTGSVIDFGFQLSTGIYTVVAMNATTACTRNMASSVTVVIDPLPVAYSVTGGGGYCTGGPGADIRLSNSTVGLSYQLYVDGTPVGSPLTGTGSALDFGLQTTTGTYSVIATNLLTTCTNNMSNTVTVSVNPRPIVYAITGGGSYCAGGTGVSVGVGGSDLGVNYQLYVGSLPIGSPVAGTGAPIDFGSITSAGVCSVVATRVSTGCTSNMLGSVSVAVNPAPVAYPVIGGGNYCAGGSGVHIGIAGSSAGISYQLYNGTALVGGAMTGSGPAIDFGLQTTTGTYTVVGTDMTTGCTGNMSGSAAVGVNALPAVFNVTGGGSFCAGTGGVHVGLNGSASGVNYQLMNGIISVGSPVPGTGGVLDLGLQTGAATYTVVATNVSTTCTNAMAGSATVTVNPTVTPIVTIANVGGDTLCAGNFTVFTAVPVNGGGTPVYQWSVNGVVAGLSSSYGYIPLDGDVLSVTMTSSALCASPLTATKSKTMIVETPGDPTVTATAYPGTEVCQGTSVNFVATPSLGGNTPAYTWIQNGSTAGTGPSVSLIPANGDVIYCIMTSNYHCRRSSTANSNHITMIVDVSQTPTVTVTASPGTNIGPGQQETLTANVTGGGPAPTYQWMINGVVVPGATSQVFVYSSFTDMDVATCQVWSSGGCTGLTSSGNITIHVRNVGVQPVSLAGSDIKLVPNPNKGIFTVKGSLGSATDEEVSLEVSDMLGQVVYTNKVIAHNGEINELIQLSSKLANGVYIMNLRSGTENKVFHLVIEQ